MNTAKAANDVLAELLEGGLAGAWLVRRDGLMAVGDAKGAHDDVTISAMTAAMAGAADVAISSLGRGGFDHMTVDLRGDELAIIAVDDEHLLVALVPEGEKLDIKAAQDQVQAALA